MDSPRFREGDGHAWIPAFAGMTAVVYVVHVNTKKARQIDGLAIFVASRGRGLGGRYWIRTSDLYDVNVTL